MATHELHTRRWTRAEYERLIELGVFRPGERLELLDGYLVLREPQYTPHTLGIRMVEEALRLAFPVGWDVRVQMPIALDDYSEPEPDVAVVPGSYRDYRTEHPSQPALVVEVSQRMLATDRRKARLYARAGVPEFWIVNLVNGVLEVYRAPAPAPRARAGVTYRDVRHLARPEFVSPLAAPDARIAVADLVP